MKKKEEKEVLAEEISTVVNKPNQLKDDELDAVNGGSDQADAGKFQSGSTKKGGIVKERVY